MNAPNEVAVVRHQLSSMESEFRAALPAHIPVERFGRVLMTGIQNNPELLECERRSLWNAAMKAAQDGLLPDGREGALVVRRDQQRGKTANWQPMIAGVRKKARNSGEIVTWDAHVVCAGDFFEFQLGDNPQINHSYDLKTERGPIIGAYSVATLKDGQKSYEVMSVGEVYAVRDKTDAWKAFKAGKIRSTPWADHEGEMARKTVAKRHSKVLPMSTDLDDLMRRDDELYDIKGAREEAQADRPKSLASKLDALAAMQNDELDAKIAAIAESAVSGGDEPDAENPMGRSENRAVNSYTLEAARRHGANARRQGHLKKACPGVYRNTELALEWQDGWTEEDVKIAAEMETAKEAAEAEAGAT